MLSAIRGPSSMRSIGAATRAALTNRSYATVSSTTSAALGRQYGASAEPRDANIPATLHLKTGQSFTGKSFGCTESKFGETVFSTSITSYTESMTDPSYSSQILVFTTPMIGNYGVPHNSLSKDAANGGPLMSLESDKIQCRGIIVSDVAEKYSHYLARESLHEWCKRHKVPGITGVDTRAITNLLRNNGTTLGKIAIGEGHDAAPSAEEYWDPAKDNLIAQASTKSVYTLNEDPTNKDQIKIALLDFGAKANIMRSLVKRGAAVTVLPWDTPLDSSLMSSFDGLFLSNGPGDPLHGKLAADNVRQLLDSEWWCNRPVFGICMGNQILGLAAGMETYRMPYGNRGHNQPVLALASSGVIKKGRVYVTSQNREYSRSSKHVIMHILTDHANFFRLPKRLFQKFYFLSPTFLFNAYRPVRSQTSRFSQGMGAILHQCQCKCHLACQNRLSRNFGLTEIFQPFLHLQDSSVEGIKSTLDSGKKVWGE